MIPPRRPQDEDRRLAALYALQLLDTDPEERFDRVTRLARRAFQVPIALVSLVDEDRQWFKSKQGLAACQTSRHVSFCGHAILDEQPLVVADALLDVRFHDNPLVTGAPHIRFYAGYPLRTLDGSRVGTLCIIDRQPRTPSPDDIQLLCDLGRIVEDDLNQQALALCDPLTGLSNRRGFALLADHALRVCARQGWPARLAHLTVDDFDGIVAQHGPAAGDHALQRAAFALRTALRDSDVLARVGAASFCVLLSNVDRVFKVVERFHTELEFQALECPHPLTASVGFAPVDPRRPEGLGKAMQTAQASMEAARQAVQAG